MRDVTRSKAELFSLPNGSFPFPLQLPISRHLWAGWSRWRRKISSYTINTLMTQTIIGMTQLNVAKTSLCTTSFQSVVSFVRHCSSTASSQLDSVEWHEPCRRCLGNPKNTLASLYDVVKATAACSSAFFFSFHVAGHHALSPPPSTVFSYIYIITYSIYLYDSWSPLSACCYSSLRRASHHYESLDTFFKVDEEYQYSIGLYNTELACCCWVLTRRTCDIAWLLSKENIIYFLCY